MTTPPISPDHKAWANTLRQRLGGDCEVVAYHDDADQQRIHVFTSRNGEGQVAASVGLMDAVMRSVQGQEIRTEVLMDQRGHDPRLQNILSTICFHVFKNGWKLAPGVIFEHWVSMYIPETGLPHVMFVAPWQFEDFSRVALTGRTIFPLVAVPISAAEADFVSSGGDLEALWERQGTDVLDWTRASAI